MKKLLIPIKWLLDILALIIGIPAFILTCIGLEIYDLADSLKMYINGN